MSDNLKVNGSNKAILTCALTGVLTRACFRHDLGNLLAQSGNASQLNLLGIVRATELSIINPQRGFPAGDQYLTDA